MRSIDYAYLAIVVALWAAVFWYRAQSRGSGELWWSCVCIAAIITLKIGVIADPFNRLTGGVYLDQLIIHLVGIVMVTLTLSWLVLARFGTRHALPRARLGAAAGMLVFLVVTWFLAPIYDIPASSDWIPAEVQVDPVMAVHWLGFHLYLFAFTVAFTVLAWPAARTLPPGSVRLSIRLLIVGAVLFGLKSGAESLAQITVFATGQAEPAWLMQTVNVVVLLVFALFLLAVTIPLALRRNAPSTADDPTETLWGWIRSAGQSEQTTAADRHR